MERSNTTLIAVVRMINDRSGLWQITDERLSLLRKTSHLSPRAKIAVIDMLEVAARGERFWRPTVEHYLALDEIKRASMKVDKRMLEIVIREFSACAKRDGVSHREWVKNTLDVLIRLVNDM